MSGHSHFRTIMHKKGLADAKRSQIFSRITKELTVAAHEGADPNANPRLRSVIDKAREANMPSDNIERAIKKGAGSEDQQFQEILVEAYGPGGIALLISAITDNKNRTVGEIRQILNKNQGKFVEEGSVRWLFERQGVLTVQPPEENFPLAQKEELELLAIESGDIL